MWRLIEFKDKADYTAYDQMLDFINQRVLKPGRYSVVRSDFSHDTDRFLRYELNYWEEEPVPEPSDVA